MKTNRNIVCKNFIKNDTGYVHFAGFGEITHPIDKKQLRILGNHAIAYLTKGSGSYIDQTGFQTDLQAGDLVFVDPQFAHRYGPDDNQTWEEIFFVFGGAHFDHISNYAEIIEHNRIGKLHPIDYHKKELLEIMTLFQVADPKDTFYLLSRIQLIIAKAFQKDITVADSSINAITEATTYIKQNLNKELDLHDLASQLNLNYESFRKKFKQATGLSPMQYRLSSIMENACHQLLTTDKKIKQIAEDLNFCSEFFFSQQFKKSQGISPKKYREIMTNKN